MHMEVIQPTVVESGLGNAENTSKQDSKSKELIRYVDETPFAVVQTEMGFYVIMGKYRMSESFKSYEEAEQDAKRVDWMRILQVMGAVVENYNLKTETDE